MFCEKCGNQLPEGAVICPNCGCAVNGAAQAQAQPQYQQTPPQYQQAQPQQQQVPPQYGQVPPQYGQVPPQYGQQPYQQPAEQKSKLAAGLLAIFVGTLGIHNFYLGFTTKGLIQLLVSILTLGIGAPAIAIWALIEGIFYLTGHEGYTADAKGIPLGE